MKPETQQHPETSTNSGNPPVLGVVGDVLTQITNLLDPESRQNIEVENIETQRLIAILKVEIKKVSKSLDYDYKISDYEKRLLISDEKFEEVLERILSENSLLKSTFENLLSKYSGDKEVYKKLLIKTFLEDLVYESLSEDDLIQGNELDLTYGTLLKGFKNNKEQLFEDLKNSKSVDLGSNNLGSLGVKELQFIFSNIKNIKVIDLRFNNLGILLLEQLQAIFSNLTNAKSVNLEKNNLSEEQEKYIKSVLPNTKISF